MSFLSVLPPDAVLLALTGGLLLIYVELNRPGLILPGASGLAVTLLAASHFFRSVSAVFAFVLGLALFALSTRMRSRLPYGLVATAAFAFAFLAPGSVDRPHLALALFCALFLGAGTSFLTTIAARARQNKGLDLR